MCIADTTLLSHFLPYIQKVSNSVSPFLAWEIHDIPNLSEYSILFLACRPRHNGRIIQTLRRPLDSISNTLTLKRGNNAKDKVQRSCSHPLATGRLPSFLKGDGFYEKGEATTPNDETVQELFMWNEPSNLYNKRSVS